MSTIDLAAGPATALFGKSRRAILGLLYSHPDELYYLRQIARIARVALGAAQRELASLEAAGIITRTRYAGSVFFQANRLCPIYPELLGLVTKTMGASEALRVAFEPLAGRIEFAFIFGSLASARQDKASDIDLLVIGDLDTRDVMAVLGPLQPVLQREINPVVMAPAEFRRRTASRESFMATVLAGSRILLIGDEGELARVAKQRLAEESRDQS